MLHKAREVLRIAVFGMVSGNTRLTTFEPFRARRKNKCLKMVAQGDMELVSMGAFVELEV